ncbi:unnamed protein product [Arctogadus glacialis]
MGAHQRLKRATCPTNLSVNTYTHMHAHTHTHKPARIHTHTHTHNPARIHTHTHTHTHTYTHRKMHKRTHTNTHTYSQPIDLCHPNTPFLSPSLSYLPVPRDWRQVLSDDKLWKMLPRLQGASDERFTQEPPSYFSIVATFLVHYPPFHTETLWSAR